MYFYRESYWALHPLHENQAELNAFRAAPFYPELAAGALSGEGIRALHDWAKARGISSRRLFEGYLFPLKILSKKGAPKNPADAAKWIALTAALVKAYERAPGNNRSYALAYHYGAVAAAYSVRETLPSLRAYLAAARATKQGPYHPLNQAPVAGAIALKVDHESLLPPGESSELWRVLAQEIVATGEEAAVAAVYGYAIRSPKSFLHWGAAKVTEEPSSNRWLVEVIGEGSYHYYDDIRSAQDYARPLVRDAVKQDLKKGWLDVSHHADHIDWADDGIERWVAHKREAFEEEASKALDSGKAMIRLAAQTLGRDESLALRGLKGAIKVVRQHIEDSSDVLAELEGSVSAGSPAELLGHIVGILTQAGIIHGTYEEAAGPLPVPPDAYRRLATFLHIPREEISPEEALEAADELVAEHDTVLDALRQRYSDTIQDYRDRIPDSEAAELRDEIEDAPWAYIANVDEEELKTLAVGKFIKADYDAITEDILDNKRRPFLELVSPISGELIETDHGEQIARVSW